MRTFYIFNIQEEFRKTYENQKAMLFNFLYQLYFMDKDEASFAYHILNQMIIPLDKSSLDNKIFIALHRYAYYKKQGNVHYINQVEIDEISTLVIKRAMMKLKTNKEYSAFFKIFEDSLANYFVCDFEYSDYFWLTEIKSIVKSE